MVLNPESHARGIDKFTTWRSLRNFYVLLTVFFIALLFHFDLAPLEETNGDAAIYVYLSKQAAKTNILADYHQNAHDIFQHGLNKAQQDPKVHWDTHGDINANWDTHWIFMRIGHILLLGEVTRFFGTTETALVAMQWLYRVFMALGVSLCVVIGLRLVALFRSEKPDAIWWAGYLLAAITYVASDSYRGLQGNLLSEPPAFLILALFAMMLLIAVERRSIAIGACAGCLLFVLFFIRADAVLPGVTFSVVLLTAIMILRKFDAIQSIVIAGLVSLTFYLLYAWWFSPLVNPQTLANFSSVGKEMYPGVPAKGLFSIAVAGGLLWVGACAALPMWRDPMIRFALVWLGLALLPIVINSLNGYTVQARMAFSIVLPLLVLSGEGWGWILRRFIKQRKIYPLAVASGLVGILAFVPNSLVMQESRKLAINHLSPEAHKYLFVSLLKTGAIGPAPQYQDSSLGLLVRAINERMTLDYLKAREIGNYLYVPERPAYLLWPSDGRLVGQIQMPISLGLRLFRYFGEEYSEHVELTKFLKKTDAEPCTARVPTESEPVVFCSTLTPSGLEVLRKDKIPLYILGVDGYRMPDMPQVKLKVLLSASPFVLYGIDE